MTRSCLSLKAFTKLQPEIKRAVERAFGHKVSIVLTD